MESSRTTCCIVGGGPAGVMLGYLLARAGVQVTVLEKHKDFFRDFRGDTVHPSTMQLMKELGILEDFLRQPHQQVDSIRAVFGGYTFEVAALRNLKIDTPFIALMPQWEFLNFLSGKAKAYPEFNLLMEHEAIDLIPGENRIRGVIVKSPSGEKRIEADLVVACDGRHSLMRKDAALPLKEIGVPIDVLWFSISRLENDPVKMVMGSVNFGKLLVLLQRDTYFQVGLVIEKGSFDKIQQDGIEAFRKSVIQMIPQLGDRANEIEDWDQIKLLSVQINRLRQWSKPGILCIGDAAHAMSPVFGVGINLAIQDAVAAANYLAAPLAKRQSTDALLDKIRQRREFPTRGTQWMQMRVHHALKKIFRNPGPARPPLLLKIVTRIPGLQTFFARTVGIGLRPEHIQTADVHPNAGH
jgi:2-polyprenyl-6-methoxyphenol hydroxylase-like FAD-dependent oxidoreductase